MGDPETLRSRDASPAKRVRPLHFLSLLFGSAAGLMTTIIGLLAVLTPSFLCLFLSLENLMSAWANALDLMHWKIRDSLKSLSRAPFVPESLSRAPFVSGP